MSENCSGGIFLSRTVHYANNSLLTTHHKDLEGTALTITSLENTILLSLLASSSAYWLLLLLEAYWIGYCCLIVKFNPAITFWVILYRNQQIL